MSGDELGAELAFVCACCRRPDDSLRRARIAELAKAVGDWDKVERLALAHRVQGLVAHGAASASVSAAVARTWAAIADRVKRRALDDLAETVRLSRALGDAGIQHAILKGVPLGVRAFGTPILKQSWDIDLLVAPADAVAAAQALVELGYAPHVPARRFTEAEFRRWSAVSKEAEFRSPGGRTAELHWAVSDHPMLLSGIGVDSADRPVELLQGAQVPTLGDSANLAYLAVHGASHGWSRLKWLADFAGLIAGRPEGEREALLRSAREHGVGHSLDQALILCERLLGAGPGPVPTSGEALELARLASTVIDRRGRSADFDSDGRAARAIGEIRRRLIPGARYRLILGYRLLRGSEDRRLIPLMRGFGWAYWLIRPFSTIIRAGIRRAFRARC